jgi:hypothetical protein
MIGVSSLPSPPPGRPLLLHHPPPRHPPYLPDPPWSPCPSCSWIWVEVRLSWARSLIQTRSRSLLPRLRILWKARLPIVVSVLSLMREKDRRPSLSNQE